jgi:hypothetical protein
MTTTTKQEINARRKATAFGSWLRANLPAALMAAALATIIGYLANIWLMARKYDGFAVPPGSPATGSGNLVPGALFWIIASSILFGVAGYWRAVGTTQFFREVRALPTTIAEIFRQDGRNAIIHVLWGAGVSLVIALVLSPSIGAIAGVGILLAVASPLGQVLAALIFRISTGLLGAITSGRATPRPPLQGMLTGFIGAAIAMAATFFVSSDSTKAVVAIGCGVLAFVLTRGAAPAQTLLIALLAFLLVDLVNGGPASADDGGWLECELFLGHTPSFGEYIDMCDGARQVLSNSIAGGVAAGIGGPLGLYAGHIAGNAPRLNPPNDDGNGGSDGDAPDVIVSGPDAIRILLDEGWIEPVGTGPDGRPIYRPKGPLKQFNDLPQYRPQFTKPHFDPGGSRVTNLGGIAFHENPGGDFTDITLVVGQAPSPPLAPPQTQPVQPNQLTPPDNQMPPPAQPPKVPPTSPPPVVAEPPPVVTEPPPVTESPPVTPPPGPVTPPVTDPPAPPVVMEPPPAELPPSPPVEPAPPRTSGLDDETRQQIKDDQRRWTAEAEAETSKGWLMGLGELGTSGIVWVVDRGIDLLGGMTGPKGKGIKAGYLFLKGVGSGLGESIASGDVQRGDYSKIAKGAGEGVIDVLSDRLSDVAKSMGGFPNPRNWGRHDPRGLLKLSKKPGGEYIKHTFTEQVGNAVADWGFDVAVEPGKDAIKQALSIKEPVDGLKQFNSSPYGTGGLI